MFSSYLKLIRVPQWIKNLFVFVPLIFSRHLFDVNYFVTVLGAFFLFCFISSIVYIMNDIIDIEADRAHPTKRDRPLASGKIEVKTAVIIAIILGVITMIMLSFFNMMFILSVIGYLILNIFYSTTFKHIVILDVFSIAAGFMLRIVAGAFVISVEISSWLILTTMFISLFLAVMKRRSELQHQINADNTTTRKVLMHYTPNFTDQMATIAAAGTIICYALYTVAERTVEVFGTDNLIFTTPFVVFGIFRYMYLVYLSRKGEIPSETMVTDRAMIVNIVLYTITAVVIIYFRIIRV
jgi:4-hydroxybenzoate polyprenyltransferase